MDGKYSAESLPKMQRFKIKLQEMYWSIEALKEANGVWYNEKDLLSLCTADLEEAVPMVGGR